MKINLRDTPRNFSVGGRTIDDYGQLHLNPQELVTLVTKDGAGCDLTATEWGFYLGSSLNSRMINEGFKVALVQNSMGRLFINAVQMDKIQVFEEYLKDQKSRIIKWLDEIN